MTRTSDATSFFLPETLDHDALRDLVAFLAAHRGGDVVIDGAVVTQIGAYGAQILAVAGRAWAVEKAGFRVSDPSGVIADSLARLGMSTAVPGLEGVGA